MTQTPSNAGASTDQTITGAPETDEFPTDKPPAADTPSSGSSNKGINDRRGNRDEGVSEEPPPSE